MYIHTYIYVEQNDTAESINSLVSKFKLVRLVVEAAADNGLHYLHIRARSRVCVNADNSRLPPKKRTKPKKKNNNEIPARSRVHIYKEHLIIHVRRYRANQCLRDSISPLARRLCARAFTFRRALVVAPVQARPFHSKLSSACARFVSFRVEVGDLGMYVIYTWRPEGSGVGI